MTRERRLIRMSEEEWAVFKNLLGPEWLREKIREAKDKEEKEKAAAQWTN